jgi:hypothetical protein
MVPVYREWLWLYEQHLAHHIQGYRHEVKIVISPLAYMNEG